MHKKQTPSRFQGVKRQGKGKGGERGGGGERGRGVLGKGKRDGREGKRGGRERGRRREREGRGEFSSLALGE